MRRLVFSIIVASGLVLVGAGSASAEPTPGAGTAKALPGKRVCKIEDAKLDELSGLIATKDGFIVVNDSAVLSSHKRVFYLDDNCRITKSVRFGGNGPRDTEDMALSPDGRTLWIGDIGDNDKTRSTIGLWKMDVGGSREPTLYRLSYPPGDGPYDAEGLVINGDGTPIVLTKEPTKVSMFVPTGPLKADTLNGVPMRRAGEIKLPSSTTENPLGPLGRFVATGAAVSPDGAKVVVRTYADAFEWPVSNGDVLGAFKGTPIQTPLPNEPQGEAITYSADGKYFYTVSDMQGRTGADNYLLRYTPAVEAAVTRTAGGATGGGSGKGPSWYSELTLNDITYLVGGVGVLGAILVGFGIFGIVRARKRPPIGPAGLGDDPDGPKPGDAETELLPVGGAPRRPVYARGGRQGRGGPPPGVYGGRPGGPDPAGGAQRGSGLYGGQPANGRPASTDRPAQGGGARPVPDAGRPAHGGGRPAQGGGRPAQGGGRPAPGGRPVPGGGQPAARPVPGGGQGGGRPAQGGAQPPGRGGVYGVPPSPPPSGRNSQGGPSQRSSGSYGRGGRPDGGGRQAGQGGGGYADVNAARGRDYDNPGFGRGPYDR